MSYLYSREKHRSITKEDNMQFIFGLIVGIALGGFGAYIYIANKPVKKA